MNQDNGNNERDEYLEASEEVEYGDFNSPENAVPEVVQARIDGSSLVYPDLVRVQLSNNNGTSNSIISTNADVVQQSQVINVNPSNTSNRNCNYSSNGGAIPRTTQRVLDPPDVSLLSLSSTSTTVNATNKPNIIDLCSSTHSKSKSFFQNNISAKKNNTLITSSKSISSIISDSTASTSSLRENSPVVLENKPKIQNDLKSSLFINNENYHNSTPSTSNDFISSNIQREVQTLEKEKTLLKQQLVQRECQITDLQQTMFTLSKVTHNLEETVCNQISDSFEKLNSKIENSMSLFEQRIEKLENCLKTLSLTLNGIEGNSKTKLTNDLDSPGGLMAPFAQTFVDIQNRLREQQRQEMFSLFRNILSSAVKEIDNFSPVDLSINNSNSKTSNGC